MKSKTLFNYCDVIKWMDMDAFPNILMRLKMEYHIPALFLPQRVLNFVYVSEESTFEQLRYGDLYSF